MIKHHVLWRYTPEGIAYGKEKVITELNEGFKKLVGVVNGLQMIEIRECSVKADPGFHDVLLYAEFLDEKSLMCYMLHPAHTELREWDKAYVCDRAGFDYEV